MLNRSIFMIIYTERNFLLLASDFLTARCRKLKYLAGTAKALIALEAKIATTLSTLISIHLENCSGTVCYIATR